MGALVAVEDLHKSYGATRALRGLSFSLDTPQTLAVLGPNGAGKTTLFAILEGLTPPDRGRITLFGAPLDPRRYPREKIGVVLQREYALDGITTEEYAALYEAIYNGHDTRREIVRRAGLGARASTPVARLSGGEAQRLFIAAALAHQPALLFLDEPSAALDPRAKRELRAWLKEQAHGLCCLVSTHDLREAEELCDSVLFLVRGERRAFGSKEQLLAETGAPSLEAAFFQVCAARLSALGELEEPT